MKTHKELYPGQYKHPLVGKRVNVFGNTGTKLVNNRVVERVVQCRFGLLAIMEGDNATAYAVDACKVVE